MRRPRNEPGVEGLTKNCSVARPPRLASGSGASRGVDARKPKTVLRRVSLLWKYVKMRVLAGPPLVKLVPAGGGRTF